MKLNEQRRRHRGEKKEGNMYTKRRTHVYKKKETCWQKEGNMYTLRKKNRKKKRFQSVPSVKGVKISLLKKGLPLTWERRQKWHKERKQKRLSLFYCCFPLFFIFSINNTINDEQRDSGKRQTATFWVEVEMSSFPLHAWIFLVQTFSFGNVPTLPDFPTAMSFALS